MDNATQVDEQTIRADERERLRQIELTCKGEWGVLQPRVDGLKAKAVASEIDMAELSRGMLGILRESRPNINSIWRGSDRPAGHGPSDVATLEAAFCLHMGMGDLGEKALGEVAMERGQQLRATHTLDLCRAALLLEGKEVPSGREQMVKAALSSYSLPTALGNIAGKVLMEAYRESPATWRSFCATRSASDFKPQTAIRPSFATPLEQIGPDGEIKHGSVSEWFTQYQVDTFGRMLSIDRRDLINDDLSLFNESAHALGRAAMRKLSDLVYEVLLGNSGGFFSAGNGNYFEGADAALTFESLAKAINLMMVQRDAEGNDLDLRPRTLLVPPQLHTTAKALLESEYLEQIAENVPTGNSLRRAVSLEVEPRLANTAKYGAKASTNHWYLFAGPASVPMVVAFLQGQQAPTVEYFGLDQNVNKLAVSWRVYFDFGSSLADPRAAVRSKGAA